MAKLNSNDAAPELALPDQHGRTVKLADFSGGKLLVYFYPKADTPGCTRQACSIRDAREELRDLGLAVVGISPDQPARQQKFDDKYGLNFPLLADPDHRVAEAYGAWGEKTSYGKKSMGIIRSSFLIDGGGEDRGGLVRGQTGRHGAQGREGVARGVRGSGGRCALHFMTAQSRRLCHRFDGDLRPLRKCFIVVAKSSFRSLISTNPPLTPL